MQSIYKKANNGANRLSDSVKPVSYKLFFNTDFKNFVYEGTEEIAISISKPLTSIKINSNKIKFKDAKIISKGVSQDCKVKIDEKSKTATLSFNKSVSGKAVLLIAFSGVNNDDMYGFYKSEYTDQNGKKEYLLTSQFEAADARAAFPCFDEPKFKATFDVTMEIPDGMLAISNMPIKSETASKGRKTVRFLTTPKMSSYLLFLGAGKFDRASTSLGKLKISVLATPGKKQLCYLALDYAKKFIAFYENYFGIKYPLPKVDLIAIPDFAAGAMENWGAITFRETAMLGTEKGSAISYKQQIAETVAHELAHQWFGDLVTMEWWNDLWLNESFATYMSFKAMDFVFPEWQMSMQYFDDVIATAFSADSLIHTHPISVDVSTPEEINEIFDEISYEKGGTFLHMLEDFATPKVFRSGLHSYLKAHSYSNATKYDLWNAIYKEALKSSAPNGKFIKEFANKWLDNVGYPLIKVKEGKQRARLSQQRFVISKPVSRRIDLQKWVIPIKYLSGNKVRFELMTKDELEIAHKETDVLKLNYGQDYLYRAMYEKRNLEKLGMEIKSGRLSGLDAWGAENDLFALMRSGAVSAADYIEFVKSYCIGVGYPANASILSHIDWLDFMLYGTRLHDNAKSLGLAFAGEMLKRLGWDRKKNERNIDSLMRSHSIRLLGQLGNQDVVKKANSIFSRYSSGKGEITPDLRSSIYATCAANGGPKLFETILKMYKKAKNPEEKRRLLQTFGYFTSKAEIDKALKFCMSPEVRLQDSFVIPAVMSGNPRAMGEVERWTYANWLKLMEKYSIGTHMLPRYIENLSMCSSKQQYLTVENFFNKKANFRGDIKISLQKTLERIMANSTFRSKNGI
ncbi:MAG: hypothetical protein BK997_01525 [Candidatus Micrarchaeum sp. ARMAN-1]|nr:MAG: hypothetical protein BK997_01525 [Candidatus Micrarchaeum sp. ARMAN-1]